MASRIELPVWLGYDIVGTMRLPAVVLMSLGIAVTLPAVASACLVFIDLKRPVFLPEFDHETYLEDVPANRMFLLPGTGEQPNNTWRGPDDEPLEFVMDEAATEMFKAGESALYADYPQTVYRLVDPGAVVGFHVEDECEGVEVCGFTLGPVDLVPPKPPEISNLEVTLYRAMGGGSYECPNIENMLFDVTVSDDRSAVENLRLAAYIAINEATLAKVTEPSVVWQLGRPDFPTIKIPLGEGGGHSRDGQHFRRDGHYCFAITAIDMAGNESERSKPECIDTTDPSDDRVDWVRGCGCSTGQASWQGAPWLLVALLGGGSLRRRRRR